MKTFYRFGKGCESTQMALTVTITDYRQYKKTIRAINKILAEIPKPKEYHTIDKDAYGIFTIAIPYGN